MSDCFCSIQYLRAAEITTLDPQTVLATVGFGNGTAHCDVRIPLQNIDQATQPQVDTDWLEVWTVNQNVHSGQHDQLYYRACDDLLFGWVVRPATEDISHASESAYQQLLNGLPELGYPHLLRMWNFLDDINQGAGDQERYKQFCTGRYSAMAQQDQQFEQRLPAATAIGGFGSDLVIFFVAGRQAGQHVENPRQVEAWRYPREYGPRSPSFSRATSVDWLQPAQLWVSGTASVVGHQSCHHDDVLAQLEETCRNLNTLLNDANLGTIASHPGLYKLYTREPADLPLIAQQLKQQLHPDAQVLYLHGQVCRAELLLEIEACYSAA